MANIFNLGMKKGDNEELLKVVPEEIVGTGIDHVAEEESKGKETAGVKTRRTSKKFLSEGFSGSFCRSQQAP